MKYIFYFFLLCWGFIDSYAQKTRPDFLKSDNQMMVNSVNSLCQDKKGFIWIGTEKGLSRYDGYELKIISSDSYNENCLTSNIIRSMNVDERGFIWIGTAYGLNRYNPEKESCDQFYSFNKNKYKIAHNIINQVYCSSDSSVWIATDNGCNKIEYEGDSLLISSFTEGYNEYRQLIPLGKIAGITNDILNNTWIAGEKGLFYLSRLDMIPRLVKPMEGITKIQIIHNPKNTLGQILWIGSEKELIYYQVDNSGNISNGNIVTHNKESIRATRFILYTNDEVVWIGTAGNGVYKYTPNGKTEHITHNPSNDYGLSNNYLRCCLIDQQESIWLGTDAGINRFEQGYQFHLLSVIPYHSKDIKIKNVHAIYEEEDGIVWIGTKGDGLFLVDPKREKSNHLSFDYLKAIRSIFKSENGDYFIGTDGMGLLRVSFDRVNLKINLLEQYTKTAQSEYSLASNRIYSICEDNNLDLWIATDNGLSRFIHPERKIHGNRFITYRHNPNDNYSLSTNNLYSLYKDSRGTIWIGTIFDGLSQIYNLNPLTSDVFNGENKHVPTFINYPGTAMINSPLVSIYACTEDKNHNLWLASNMGLIQFKTTENTFRLYTTKEGLSDNDVYGIIEDGNDNLWISTLNGLTQFNISTEKTNCYYKEDGLQDDEFNGGAFFKADNGKLFFGGRSGINSFFPTVIKERENPIHIVFTDLRIFNSHIDVADGIIDRNISYLDKITLSHKQNFVGVSFSALNFKGGVKGYYMYKLEGLSDEWLENGDNNSVYFNALPPGEYTLYVKAMTPGGEWVENAAKLKIKILKPIWLTWPAFLCYSIVFVLLLLIIKREVKVRLALKQKLYQSRIEKKQNEELNEHKLQFFTDISHELRTPFSLIISPLETLLDRNDLKLDIRKQLSLMYRNSRRLNILLDQILAFQKMGKNGIRLNASEGDIVGFSRNILYSFRDLARSNEIKLTFETSVESVSLWFDTDKTEKILYNLISNAFKYNKKGGVIRLSIRLNPTHVLIEISDTGKGIAKEDLSHIFDRFYQIKGEKGGAGIGLSVSKHFAELHRGTLTVDSIPGTGSVFTLMLPLGKDHLAEGEISCEQAYSAIAPSVKETNPMKEDFLIQSEKKEYKILIVEDHPELLGYLWDILSKLYRVIRTNNGVSGFELAVKENPDLIISDIIMPEMGGIELVRKLKANTLTERIPIILLTAKSQTEHQIEGISAGADMYITKPFSPKYLLISVSRLIEGREQLKKYFDEKVYGIVSKKTDMISENERFEQKLHTLIKNNIENEELSVEILAEMIGMSRANLYRKVKSLTGKGPNELIRDVRLVVAAELLSQNKYSIASISYSVGIKDPQYFAKIFKKHYGKSPSQYASDFSSIE